nr:unnamed protein product [Callosobruchus chinensis]
MVNIQGGGPSLGGIRLLVVFGVSLVFVPCGSASSPGSSVFSPASNTSGDGNGTPAHRGAARQMFGSGQLRPANQRPAVYATGRHTSPRGSTERPPLYESPPFYGQGPPLVMTKEELGRFFAHFQPNVMQGFPKSDRPLGRSGGYGTEQGRPRHTVAIGKYPMDLGLLIGKGLPPIDYVEPPFLGRYPLSRINDYDDERIPVRPENDELEENIHIAEESDCDKRCKSDEWLCDARCVCIKREERCDGKNDCGDNEDELDCTDLEQHTIECDESKNYVMCPRTIKCISKDWLCDGDDDCGDLSDETNCNFKSNCTENEFKCTNGLCIPKQWLCDNDNDCKDLSDENNCTMLGCNENEFECTDTSCISLSWKCDRHIDCTDGSDEIDCEIIPPTCENNEFQCTSRKCIKEEFKCDGDGDCEDWSDEDDCPKIPGSCVTGEFKCNKGNCIPERYRCDKQQDCEDNEDEANCDYNITKTCSPDEFTCNNGACILRTWRCDGNEDCPNGEDESKCEIECDASKFPCSGYGNNTAIEFCINKKYRCDGQKDCPKGEDEQNCPKSRECERDTKCEQLCITSADGKKGCSCFNGYQLAKNGYSCEDINECLFATDPVCSQTCNNTIGSFKCGCMTGYVLRPDMRTCKALGAPPTLLFANRVDIRQVSLSNTKYISIIKGLHNAISLDYHYEKNFIVWTDVSQDAIWRAYINGTNITGIVRSGLESPGGIALDWIHDLIFWTDSGTRRIEVATLDGRHRSIIAASEVDKPRAIAVHPGEALVFWTDYGPNPKIEKAEMDGSNRKSIIMESVFWPNGLTVDYTTNQIYWADAKHNVIETAMFDGSHRRKVVSKGLPHPFAITIFEDALFWTDWHTKSISTANKITGAGLKPVHSQLHFPMDIHSYHPQRQPKYKNRCGDNNGGCAHLCLPNRKSYICVCDLGQKLKADKKTCQKPDKFLLFAQKKDLRIKYLDGNAQNQYEMVIPISGVKSAVAIAWDSKTDNIYWTDVDRSSINKAFWNGSSHKILVHTNLISPAGIAFDWATEKIYWTDSESHRIEVANTDGSMRCLLVWEELQKPRDIAIDPQAGLMFWSEWGEVPKIERSNMDGSNRQAIVSANLTWPNGLAIDHSTNKIYWTDGGLRTIEYANMDGSNRKVLLGGNNVPHPFGLDVFGNHVYWTDWESHTIERAHKTTGKNRTVISGNMNDLMDVRIFHRNRKTIKHSCMENNGGCSHLCLLRPKSHSCACPTGIRLEDDGKTCRSLPKNFIIFAHRTDIRHISLDVPYLTDVVLPLTSLKKATSVDVDTKTGEIYWSDTEEDTISRAPSDGKTRDVILMFEMEAPDGIAVDSIGRKVYWTDGERNSLEVAELDGKNRKVLFNRDLDNPRAITIYYRYGLLFWSDWGKNGKIERAHMDGTNRKVLIGTKIAWPNGLAIDHLEQRIYWNDCKLNTIESSDLDGKNRNLIISNVPHPYGLVVVKNHIYWTDWQTRALHRADKFTGSDRVILKDNLEGLMEVRAVQMETKTENVCGNNNGGCSHLCLRNPTSYTCACPTGLRKSKLNVNHCEPIPQTFLLIATRYVLSQISLDTGDEWDVTLPIEQIRNAIDVDFHWEKKLIFFTDIERNVIQSVSMYNISDVQTILDKNLSSADGIAVDWIADNIYWTNTGNKVIEVSRLDGTSRKVIVRDNLHDPRSIAVFPKRGFLFWTDWGVPKIERSFLDGSSRRVLVDTDVNLPIGLTIDYAGRRIYWVDAKLNAEKIETSDLHGNNRIMLSIQATHPFSLTQHEDYIYWTDWIKKSVMRAEKSTGRDATIIRPQLDAAMGITMVSAERQLGWNPCAVNNGGCTHLCLFKLKNYTCGCPDKGAQNCKTEPKEIVPLKCPTGGSYKCDTEEEPIDCQDENICDAISPGDEDERLSAKHSNTFYVMMLVPMVFIVTLCLVLAGFLLIKKRKKKHVYGTSRSFSNPNYYSPNNEMNVVPNNGKFIWKRLKYDKSQERVYEETVGTSSPEITSLIPTILTPCSSNCETVTPDIERSPSVTPLHKLDLIKSVA